MYSNTRFNELMRGLPRKHFPGIVDSHQGDKYNKGFQCWDHLISMIFGQLSGSRSLRELEASFNSQSSHHYHLGSRPLKRTTLSDANRQRDPKIFEAVCSSLLAQAHRTLRAEVKDLLYLIDSTPITLNGRGYDEWVYRHRTPRSHGLKLHMQYSPKANVPTHAQITQPNVNDLEFGRQMSIEKGAMYVFDKGYYDFNWWHEIDQSGAYFVSRFKKNAAIECVETRTIPEDMKDTILEDSMVRLTNKRQGKKRINAYYDKPLRKIAVSRPDKDAPIILVTNDLSRSAQEIADLYKQRWGIELFFKWLKQNLKIKRFLGRNENAVRIQIYIALISYLLVHQYHQNTEQHLSMRMCLSVIKTGLFQRVETEYQVTKRRRRQTQEFLSLQGSLEL